MNKIICGAKLRNKDAYCQQKALKGAKRCRLHGGKTPKGIASPHFKTGADSKYLTALADRLHKAFAELRARNDLLELKDEIALIDLYILDLLKRIENGESWQDAHKAFAEFQQAKESGNVAQRQSALAKLETVFKHGSVADLRKELSEWLEKRRRFVESERKRMIERQEMITAQEAAMLISALTSVIQKFVPDRETRAKIQEEFIKLTSPLDDDSNLIN